MSTTNENHNEDDFESGEKWLIDARDPFEEFEAVYEINGNKHNVTIQAQPADQDSIRIRFLVVENSGGTTYVEYDSELSCWINSLKGETAEAKSIGDEIEKHLQFDDSAQEDAGIDNPEEIDPSKPFTGWYKLFGKKHRIRIEPVFAFSKNQYYIYNLDSEHESNVPERILLYDSELDAWVEKNTEFEYNSWLDREKGYSLYSWIIGCILDSIQ